MEARPHDPKGHMTPGSMQGPHKTPCKVWEESRRPMQNKFGGMARRVSLYRAVASTFLGPRIPYVTPSEFRRPQRPS